MVIWLIGKSGAGKTEIGKRLYDKIKEVKCAIYLDGDELRNAISSDLGHSVKDREISEKRRSALSKLLSDQGVVVICAAISNEQSIRNWNKDNIKDYLEIYLEVDEHILYERDSKNIYKMFKSKKINNVVGEDIIFNEPHNPWMKINNNGNEKPNKIVKRILSALNKENYL